jgi:hypothetical protein
MRDIRNDLTQRARLIEEEIAAAYGQYEQVLQQLQTERDQRVADLQAELAALSKLMEAEQRRMANEAPLAEYRRMPNEVPLAEQRHASNEALLALPQLVPPAPSLADFIMHKLNEMGPLSKDDLINLSLQEGTFADPESADHGVHATLVTIIRNEHVRQLHDGTFVPNTLPQALRMRRAV